ncbi:MAG: hypothetical protein HQ556_05575, partial [Candidatus Marinimicrobia bacterium]|nr:hypothetical protein [Candidatus Neomarinimicrobiota bacterium]
MSDKSPFVSPFMAELKRRKVFRVAGVYAIVAWLIIQIGESTFEALHLPPWALTFIIILLFTGFPIAIIFAWIFDKTPEGKIQIDEQDQDLRPAIKRKRTWFAFGGIIAGVILGVFIARLYSPITLDNVGINDKSVAVLPFTTFSAEDEDNSFFADGVHDDILTQLSKIKDIKVISRTSVVQYKNTTKTMSEIAKELNVQHVLEGSVRRAGDQIRIVAQLINAVTDNHIWSETYDREYADIFAIQSDVAKQIATALKATLTPKEANYLNEKPTDNLEAWDLYIKANILSDDEITDIDSVIAVYEQGIRLDKNFLQPYGKIAALHARMYFDGHGPDPSQERFAKAEQALEKARSINANHPDYHEAQGEVYYYGYRDYEQALREFYLALEAKPNDADLHKLVGFVERRKGQWEESLASLKKAHELDPNSYNAIWNYYNSLYYMRQWDELERIGKRRLLLSPNNHDVHNEVLYDELMRTGDLIAFQKTADQIINKFGPEKARETRIYVAVFNRDWNEIINMLDTIPEGGDRLSYLTRKSNAFSRLENQEMSDLYADSLIIESSALLKINPSKAWDHLYLAMAIARLG